MFRDVQGPSQADIVAAGNELLSQALQRENRVEVVCGPSPEDGKQWKLMNLGAEWLESQGLGRMYNRTSESFEFASTMG